MKYTSYCGEGRRAVNDDCYADANKNGIQCFVAADGLGKNGGAVSSLTVRTVIEEFKSNPELSAQALEGYIQRAQSAVLEIKADNRDYDTAATTIAVLLTDGKRAVYATVGDTRVYILRNSYISEISEDHSESFEKFEANHIAYSEIRNDADRHKLRRAIGDKISWEPDVSDVMSINSGFSFLLCTDGFWNLISEDEIERSRRFAFSSERWLKRMLGKVMSRQKKGSDNLTAAAVIIEKTDVL